MEPDPRKNRKEGLGDRLGWRCTLRLECRHASDWFMIACQRAFIGNTNHKPLVQFKETENKQDLLAREVVGAQISFYWAYGRLEVPEMWVRTNNYKFRIFRSVHFRPRPSFRFSEGLVPRLQRTNVAANRTSIYSLLPVSRATMTGSRYLARERVGISSSDQR